MQQQRMAIYVTLLGDLTTCEAYAVVETGDGGSDLWSDVFCSSWKLPSVLAEWCSEWASERTAERSPSSPPSSR